MRQRHPLRIKKPIGIVGFGAWQLGNPSFFGEMDDDTAVQLVHRALELGVNLFDTAPGYGEGNSERLLGTALQLKREDVFINTKFGHTPDGRTDFSVKALDSSIKGSLDRLQTTYIDGLVLHNPGRDMLYGDQPIYKRLEELKETGVIQGYGVSIDSLEELEIVLKHNHVDIIEIMFNIIHQSVKELFDEVQRQGIMLLIKVPLDSGWLTGKYHKGTIHTGIRSRWNDNVIDTRLKIVNAVKSILQKDAIAEDSLRFILAHEAVTAVIPGVRNIKQLESNVSAQEQDMSADTVQKLSDLYDSYIKHQHTPW